MAKKYFDVLKDTVTPVDALEEWLGSPPINTQQDPVTYWTRMEAAGHPLAPMALDFMSTPGEFFFGCTGKLLIDNYLNQQPLLM